MDFPKEKLIKSRGYWLQKRVVFFKNQKYYRRLKKIFIITSIGLEILAIIFSILMPASLAFASSISPKVFLIIVTPIVEMFTMYPTIRMCNKRQKEYLDKIDDAECKINYYNHEIKKLEQPAIFLTRTPSYSGPYVNKSLKRTLERNKF